MNMYLEAVGTKGGVAGGATASTITTNIDGKQGKRLGIMSYAVTPSESATNIYFMQTLQETVVSAAVASNATTLAVTAFASTPATSGVIVVVLDDGTYQWLTVASTASTTSVPISSALTDSMAASNKVYYLGLYTTTGHNKIAMTASTQKANNDSFGLFFGYSKGAPMRVHVHSSGSGVASIDHITYAYTNK
jgi:hypothetical protein